MEIVGRCWNVADRFFVFFPNFSMVRQPRKPRFQEVSQMKPKISISAQEVLNDLTSGLDDQGFMIKYELNYRQLQRLFRKMIQAGYVSPLELAERLCVTQSQVTEAFDVVKSAVKELD